VAAVGEDEDPDALLELRVEPVELVVEHLAVVEAPRLVEGIVLVAVEVRKLASVPRIAEAEDVALLDGLRGVADALDHRVARGRLGQQLVGDEASAAADPVHRPDVGLAGVERPAPARIMGRIDRVQADMK
jgi:hypothetical protein